LPDATKTRPSLDQTINWFHQIDLPDGTTTPGIDRSHAKLARLKLPDLKGKTFLDIGAWDGFFSFEAERRGASRVLATDSFVWEGGVPGYSKAGFLFARSCLGSRVEDLQIDPFDLSPKTVGLWDVVLLAGVVYHVRHPWLLLQKAASVTRELLIIETVTSLRFWPLPAISIYGSGFRGDPTNFCAPNIAALKVMLRDCGFRKVEVVSRSSVRHRRCVIHARR
jgi:tRNA (mo5U34)-methyltransferase